VIEKERSLVSKNSNSLNAMIKRSSVTINNSHLKKITFIATAIILLSVTATFGFSPNEDVYAKKPQAVIEWSNGFPSGEHANLNIHGKKLVPFYNCDNIVTEEPFGKSIFVPIEGTSKIEFVSNKRASGFHILQVLDPCAAPFGQEPVPQRDAALVQLEAKEMQVYWRILGKPNNSGGGDPSEAMLAYPKLIEACNFLPAFADNSVVGALDIDAQANGGTGLVLATFNGDEKHENDSGGDPTKFDVGETVYRDVDGDGFVSENDIRLANASTQGAFADGSIVADGDPDESFNADAGRVIVIFNGDEKHENDSGGDPTKFDVGETIYRDVDTNGFVSENDIRLANAITQGLPLDQGGDAIDCEDESLIGLGLINNKGVFDLKDQTLKRFDPESTEKGKGKSKAVDITGLFTWTGVLCNPLTAADVDGDGEISLADDFPGLMESDVKTSAEAAGVYDEDGMIDDAEFAAYIAATYPDCFAFYNEWIFIIADIVRYGIDYVNDGTTLTQMRFYPVATTTFD